MKDFINFLLTLPHRPENLRHCVTNPAQSVKLKTMPEMPGLSTLPLIGSLHHFLPIVGGWNCLKNLASIFLRVHFFLIFNFLQFFPGTVGPTNNFFELAGVFHEKFGPIVKLEGIFARAPMVILYEPAHFDQVSTLWPIHNDAPAIILRWTDWLLKSTTLTLMSTIDIGTIFPSSVRVQYSRKYRLVQKGTQNLSLVFRFTELRRTIH